MYKSWKGGDYRTPIDWVLLLCRCQVMYFTWVISDNQVTNTKAEIFQAQRTDIKTEAKRGWLPLTQEHRAHKWAVLLCKAASSSPLIIIAYVLGLFFLGCLRSNIQTVWIYQNGSIQPYDPFPLSIQQGCVPSKDGQAQCLSIIGLQMAAGSCHCY